MTSGHTKQVDKFIRQILSFKFDIFVVFTLHVFGSHPLEIRSWKLFHRGMYSRGDVFPICNDSY